MDVQLHVAADRVRRLVREDEGKPAILVARTPSRLGKCLFELATDESLTLIDVGQELSKALITCNRTNRAAAAQTWIRERWNVPKGQALLLANTDLLFEPELELDPYQAVLRSNRLRPTIMGWLGTLEAGLLGYGQPGHAHYRKWPVRDIVVLSLDTVDA